MTSQTILVADDSRVSRMMITSMIKEKKPEIEFIEADCAEDALSAIEGKEIGYFSLDLNMPGVDGLELAEKLKTIHPDAKYVLLTANIQDFTKNRADELGVKCLHKPITDETINSMLEYFYG